MLRVKNIDATQGRLFPSIILYAIPLILTTLIQTLFNSIDLIVLRFAASSIEIASVGATSTIISLLVNTFIGLAGGTNVLLARFIGARDSENTRYTVSTSLIASFFIGIAAAAAGFFLAAPFLRLTNCPDDCFNGALLYLRIYILASPAILVYSFGSNILRTSGDTTRPLIYMVASGLLNVVLNILLCILLPQKIAAVAIATFASQVLGAVCVIVRLTRVEGDCKIHLLKLKWNTHIFVRILRFGLPICLHTALFPLANLQIQSAINSFGSSAISGNTASTSLESIVSSTTSAFGTAALTFVGQNLGADNRDRVKKSFAMCFLMSTCCGLIFGTTCFGFGEFLMSFYVGNDLAAIEYGMIRAQYILAVYFIAGMNNSFSSTLQAFGYSTFVSLNSIIAVFVFRLVWMNTIYPAFPTFHCIFLCFFVSWLMMLVCNIVMILIVFRKYAKNKLRGLS